MKHIKYISCFLFLFPYAASAMNHDCIELSPLHNSHTTSSPIIDIVESIHKKIDQQYPSSNSLIDYVSHLLRPQHEILTIINLPFETCKDMLTLNDIHRLRIKNNTFANAIDYFLSFARKNIDNVNYTTIDAISNFQAEQPTPELNILPPLVKQYVMLLARNEIKLTYEIKLEHCDDVLNFEICPFNQKIVTHCKNRTLGLWDLNTGNYVASFPEQNYLNILKFNGDGSLLVTAAYFDDTNESHIKIWDPTNQQAVCMIQLKHYVYHLDFVQDQHYKTLTAFIFREKTDRQKLLGLWNIENTEHPTFLGFSSAFPWKGEKLIDTSNSYGDYYNSHFYDTDKSTLYVEKKHCPDLHLCQQTIENCRRREVVGNVCSSIPYKDLSKYE
ncbi:MAG TPA: hypothetical protein VKU36_04740, partial [Candidatus Babeliales bacterium]|nr:hypothetical protein [Candidatus Babeliales bacterium]